MISHQKYGPKCDIYSYGLLLWEILHQRVPFATQNQVQVAFNVAVRQQRPPLSLPSSLAAHGPLIERCWAHSEAQRPTMAQVGAGGMGVGQAACGGRVGGCAVGSQMGAANGSSQMGAANGSSQMGAGPTHARVPADCLRRFLQVLEQLATLHGAQAAAPPMHPAVDCSNSMGASAR